jgi:D-glycero-D-manno-heptose 1,7-bisphosphate phosphatase
MFTPAAFLDRDGVINVDRGYTWRAQEFEFVPGVLEAAAGLAGAGFALVVVTNQSGIGRGMYTERDFHVLSEWMQAHFVRAGAPLAGIYFCPHHPADAQGDYRRACECRKPGPGMLLQAQRELVLDLQASVLFGDRGSDMQAAAAAGVPRRILLAPDGHGEPDPAALAWATGFYPTLAEAVRARAWEAPQWETPA